MNLPTYLLGLVLVASASAAPLVTNSGFEAGTSQWGKLFAPMPDNAKSNPTLVLSETGGRNDSKAMLLTSTAPGRYSFAIKNSVAVNPNDLIRLSLWYRGLPGASVEAGKPGVSLRVEFKNTDPAVAPPSYRMLFANALGLSQVDKTLRLAAAGPLPSEWTQLEVVFAVPGNANAMGFGVFAWGTTGGILVDDFVCESVPAGTALTRMR